MTSNHQPERKLGAATVPGVALGGTGWVSGERDLGIETIHAAINSGVRLIDTAHAYTRIGHPGYSEEVIGRALKTHPLGSEVVVATKGGHYREGDDYPIDARRSTVLRHVDTSLDLLGVECIDLYQLHWPDPRIPIETAMETFAELREEGLVRHVGVCNVSIRQLEEAASVVPIVSVQNSFSPFDQSDREMVDYCTEHDVAYLAHSPLRVRSGGESLTASFPAAAELARAKGISIQRLALAWLLHQSPALIALCGCGRPETARDSARAASVHLTEEELDAMDFTMSSARGDS